jgi:hypothetical protein
MDVNSPEQGQLDPDTQQIVSGLRRRQQAAPSISAFRQQGPSSSQYPQNQAYANNQGVMSMANSSFTTPPFAHNPILQRPPTNAGLATQPSFPYRYGQAQQRESTYIPFPDALSDSDFTLNDSQIHPFQSEQLAPAYNPLPFTHHGANTTQPQSMPSVAEGPTSAFIGSSSPLDTATIELQSMTTVPALGTDGLRFSSRATASETCDLLYREVFEIKDGDVIEVEQNERQHVKSFVKALKHKGFMAAPDTRMVGRGVMKTLNATEKQAWGHWQIGACKSVETRMSQPNADVNLERRAWEVFDEIVKAHKVGFRLSSLTKDDKSKCSQRIKEALQMIESHAILRQKILDGDKLSDFAVNPEDYARRTRTHHYNNADRAAKLKAEKAAKEVRERAAAAAGQAGAGNTGGGQTVPTAGPGTPHGRRAVSSTGAVARCSMPRKDLRLLKGALKGEKTVPGAKGTGDGEGPPRAASATLPAAAAAAEEAGAFSDGNDLRDRPSTHPLSGSSSDHPGMFQPQPTQLQVQEVSHSPIADISELFDFSSNWDVSSAMSPLSLEVSRYDTSSVAGGSDLRTSGIGGGDTFEHTHVPLSTQSQLRYGEVAAHSNQRAATTYGVYGAGILDPDNPALPSMQGQLHRGEVSGSPNQHATAIHDARGAVPTGGSTEQAQASVSPITRKRPRIE